MTPDQEKKIIELLWCYMKPDSEHKDRVRTGYGSKTMVGLIACIDGIVNEVGGDDHHGGSPSQGWTHEVQYVSEEKKQLTGYSIVTGDHGTIAKVATKYAPLVAAAPELLAVLKRAVPWLGKMIADGTHNHSVLPRDCEVTLDRAEAVLRKVEGSL